MPEIDLDAITRVLAPNFNSNSSIPNPMDSKTADINSFDPNPDFNGTEPDNDSGSPDSETEDAAENHANVSVHNAANTESNTNIKEADQETKTDHAKFIRKQYNDPITKEYSTQFNNFRGRPVYEDDIYDKTKFKITGMG